MSRRVVSLVPSLTETLFELGAGDRLVAVTRYCVEPQAPLRSVPRIGGTKNPDLEKIAACEPDLVLANTEENRAEHVQWLRERFEVLETMPRTVADAADVVRELGRRLGAVEEANAILLEIEAQLARAEVESLERRRVRVFYPIWRRPWMAVNRSTYVHDVLERAGAANVTAHRDDRYPVVAEDEFAGLRAELVLLPSEPYPFGPEHRRELLETGVFRRDCPVLLVDGRDFCWHGARTARGLGRAVDVLAPYRRPA